MDEDAIIDAYRTVTVASVADAVDSISGRRGFMDHDLRPRTTDEPFVGTAATLLYGPTDETVPPVHALDLIDTAPAGSVIVVSVGGRHGAPDAAVWGALLSAGAVANGHVAAVVDGAVRDVREIRRDYEFPVSARAVSPGSAMGRYRTVSAGEPITCGGVLVNPGDIVVGDTDGVVVVPRAQAMAVLQLARDIDARELAQARSIRAESSVRSGLARARRA